MKRAICLENLSFGQIVISSNVPEYIKHSHATVFNLMPNICIDREIHPIAGVHIQILQVIAHVIQESQDQQWHSLATQRNTDVFVFGLDF
jgi:hypothetical protein